MKHNNVSVLQIVDFITKYQYSGHERDVEKAVRKGLEYNTLDYGVVDNDVGYVLLMNIDEHNAHIIDLIIRDDIRASQKLIRYIIGRNWSKFPYLKTFSFERHKKYPYRELKKYSLMKYFKKGECNGREDRNSAANTASAAIGR